MITDTLPELKRDAAMQSVDENASRLTTWDKEAVKEFVIGYLREHGDASSEDITDAAKLAGHLPHDDRAFGPIYMSLSRSGKIVFAGNNSRRRKGHATRGGYRWGVAA